MNELEKFTMFSSLYSYSKDDGLFRHLRDTRSRQGKISAGEVAGCINDSGYVVLSRNGNLIRAHRLAWFIVYGEIPPDAIDHINGQRSDNRICNLRKASPKDNARNRRNIKPKSNSRLGILGVHFRKNRYVAKITPVGGKTYEIGRFVTVEEACAAVSSERERLGISTQDRTYLHPKAA